jgi:hypothetical protein
LYEHPARCRTVRALRTIHCHFELIDGVHVRDSTASCATPRLHDRREAAERVHGSLGFERARDTQSVGYSAARRAQRMKASQLVAATQRRLSRKPGQTQSAHHRADGGHRERASSTT